VGDQGFDRLESLFTKATELPRGEREAFLRKECGNNVDLFERLSTLLERDSSTSELPVTPVLDRVQQVLPERLGPYRVLHRLGEGGFAEVYAAEQTEPVRRTVAVKVLKAGMDSKSVLARFEAERQALALMDHPHVAKAHDAGSTEQGRPYFVMELVDGVPITQFCRQEPLSLQDRLVLFVSICRAVQHAHQKGVIHRDIKPSNLLVARVDGMPHAKIIDFGIAKALGVSLTDLTIQTSHDQLVGTPEYMSPEQAEIGRTDIDTRSDIYSLGVVLYELLSGGAPFETENLRGAGLSEIQRVLREVEPPRPSDRATGQTKTLPDEDRASTWARELRGDLDWITLKAMEKDRDRRYATASALAEDVERHLRNEPVEAGPPTASYRMKKFAVRNRVSLVAGSAVIFGLLSAAIAFGVSGVQARRERERTAMALAEAEAVTGFLTRTLAAAGPRQEGKDVTVREMLDMSQTSLDLDFAESPLVRARIQHTLAITYADLGEHQKADSLYALATETYRNEVGASDLRTVDVENNRSTVLLQLGQVAEAESLLVRVLAERKKTLGPDHRETLSTQLNLSALLVRQSRHEEAATLLIETREKLISLDGPDSEDACVALNGIAEIYSQQGKAEAESLMVEAHRGSARVFGSDHPRTLVAGNNLATMFFRTLRYPEATAIAEEVLQQRRESLGNDHPDTIVSMNLLAGCYLRLERMDESVTLFEETLATTKRVQGEDHPQSLLFANNVASLYRRQERFDDAERLYLETLAMGKDVLGLDHPHMILARGSLGDVYTQTRRASSCIPALADAVRQARLGLPDGHWILGETLRKQGTCFLVAKRWSDAETVLLEAHKILLAAHGESHPRVLTCAENLVELYEQSGQTEKASAWSEKAPPASEGE